MGDVVEGGGAGPDPVRRLLAAAPLLAVTALCAANAWLARGSLYDVPFFNDSTMHEQMVRAAARDISHLHWPFTQWYPLLNLGSPQFLHYQGLGATLAGALGAISSPTVVFRLSLWALVAFWPAAVYLSARVFGFARPAAAAVALAAPFLSSVPQVGYEAHAYEWFGYGVWAQLCASWALPFAWAWTWRALADHRHVWKAALMVALTAALHYETGYAAFAGVLLLPWLVPSQWRARARRAALTLAGALAGVAWIVVPLLLSARWAALNSGQAHTPLARGYGARVNLSWLVHGRLFDAGRVPVLSVAVGLGVLAAIARWRRDARARAALVLALAMFLLSWGPTTWGAVADLVPGHADIFFRRFLGPTQLGALYLVGVAAAELGERAARLCRLLAARRGWRALGATGVAGLATLLVGVAVAGAALPSQVHYQDRNTYSVNYQLDRQSSDLAAIAPIVSYLEAAHDGRVYAGLPTNWGRHFRMGIGPVYLYLADRDVDQVSSQGWAASLMEEPQALFDQSNLSDYELFGVRYLLTPVGMSPPVPARPLLTSGPYKLWLVPQGGYLSVVRVEGSIQEDKSTIAHQAGIVLRTQYFAQHVDLAVDYGTPGLAVTLPSVRPAGPVGRVTSSHVDLADGIVRAQVLMGQAGSLVLSASFDPGWQAFVDGRLVPTQMVAPALVSVPVPAGAHEVVLRYQGFRWYLPLILAGLAAVAALAYLGRRPEARRASPG